jgi:hypothetical protein
MSAKRLIVPAFVVAVGLVAAVAVTAADVAKDAAPAEQPEMKLPPGWTEEDMQACVLAGTPGEMHERLAGDVGEWHGAVTMWMGPGGETMASECAIAVTSMMDRRYTKVEWNGEMPGMGPYHGLGIYGFDNVSQQFVSTWIDNHSTGIMRGVGKLSPDGKTLSWKFTHNCPVTKKPAVIREIETVTGPGAKTIEMFAADPKSGEEYKMMRVELTRQ